MNLQMEITTVPGLDRQRPGYFFLLSERSLDISLCSVSTCPYFGLFLGHFDLANIDAVFLDISHWYSPIEHVAPFMDDFRSTHKDATVS